MCALFSSFSPQHIQNMSISVWVPETAMSSRGAIGMGKEGNLVHHSLADKCCFTLLEPDAKLSTISIFFGLFFFGGG